MSLIGKELLPSQKYDCTDAITAEKQMALNNPKLINVSEISTIKLSSRPQAYNKCKKVLPME